MATLKLSLDTRRPKKNNTYPLVFRISVNGQNRDISLGYSILEDHWNSKTESIRKSEPTYDILHKRIQELQVKYLSKIFEYEKSNPHLVNAQHLKEYILAIPKPKTTVVSFWNQEVDHLQKADRNGGARAYMESLVAIEKIKNLNIPFEAIDHSFLKEVEAELISKGVKLNSIGFYYRTLRAVYNKAIHAKEASYEHYPFRTYKIRKEPTRPRVLSKDELHKFFNIEIDKSSWLYDSWLMGKLMFMLIGINFKDMVLMKESQIQHGRLIYTRAKTQRQYSIKLLPEALEIINYFRGRSEHTILSKITPTQLDNKINLPIVIRQANKVFNKHLDKIGKMVGCKEKITGYTFRYSNVNIARQLGFSKDVISSALGHSFGLAVTSGYLCEYDNEVIDNMNATVCASVML
jgi:integrase/recombinase XerD